ncbi:hypothetical protein BGZ83_009885 [Gryganskiella cystojenkinii]|nr:hypothetical protein BGZ83_009885 [Gryganskiella cystojenkinii]
MDQPHPPHQSEEHNHQQQEQQQQPAQQQSTSHEPVHCFWALMTYGDLRFIYLSSSVQRAVSAKYKQLLGQSFFDYIHPDEAKLARKDLNAFMDVHNLYGSVTRCRFKNVCPEWKLRKQSRPTTVPAAADLQAAATEGGLSSRGLGLNGLRPSDIASGEKSVGDEAESECRDYEDIFPNGEEEDFIILDVVMNVVSDEVVLGFFHIDGQGLYKGFWSNGICGESKDSLPTLAPEIMRHLQESVRAKPTTSSSSPSSTDSSSSPSDDNKSSPPSSPHRPRYENNKTKRIFQIYDSHNRNLLLTWPQPGPIHSPGTMTYNPDLYTQIVKSHHIPADALENTTCLKRFCSKHALPSPNQPSNQDPSYQVESVFIPYGRIIFACFQTSPAAPSNAHWNPVPSPSVGTSTAQNYLNSSPSPGRLFGSQFESGSPSSSDAMSSLGALSSSSHLNSALFGGTGNSSQGSPSSALNSPLVIPSLPSLSPFLKHATAGQITISSAQGSSASPTGPIRGQTPASGLAQSQLYHPYKSIGGNNGVTSTPTSNPEASLPLPESMQESLSFLHDYKAGENDRTRGDSRTATGSSDTHTQSMWHASTPHPAIAAMVGHALSPSAPSFHRTVGGSKDIKNHQNHHHQHDRHKPGSYLESGSERDRKVQKLSSSSSAHRHPAHNAAIRKKSMSSSGGSTSPPSLSLDVSDEHGNNSGAAHGVMRIPQEEKSCESCGTTNSPEWRRGQSGKKDLCNACGLRYSRSVARQNRQAQKQLEGKNNPKVKGPKAPKAPKSGTKKAVDTEANQDKNHQQQQQQLLQQPHLQYQQQQEHQQQQQQLQQMQQHYQQTANAAGAFSSSVFSAPVVPQQSFYPGS